MAPSRNPVEAVAVATADLGSTTVAELATRSLVIPGTRESKPAKYGCIPSQQSGSSKRVLNKKALSQSMVMARNISKQVSRVAIGSRWTACQHGDQML